MVPNDEATVDTGDNEPAGDAGGEPSGDVSDQGAAAGDDGGGKTPVDRPQNRRERRANALREASDRADRHQQEATRYAQELEATRRELAEIRGQMQERARQEKRSEPSPHLGKLKDLRSQWETHAAAAVNAKLDQQTRQQHVDRAHELEIEMSRLQYKMFREEDQEGAPPDQSAQREAAAREEQYLVARFPWLDDNQEAHSYVWGKFESLVKGGRPRNRATMVEACTFIASKFGFGGTNGNGANGNSRRYAAVPSGEGAGGEDAPRSAPAKTDGNYRLAMGLYPELGKEQAFAKWAKKMQEKRGD